MEKEDSFSPNASGKSSPLFLKAMSPLTVMWRNWRIAPRRAPEGRCVKASPEGSTLAPHRVVNRHGTISLTGPDLQRQRQALLAEGDGIGKRQNRLAALSLELLTSPGGEG